MADTADFYGFEFETDFNLFFDELEEVPAVYVVYTAAQCLEIGESSNLKDSIETHPNTRQWISLAEKKDIFVAFHVEDDRKVRIDIKKHLKVHMKPKLG